MIGDAERALSADGTDVCLQTMATAAPAIIEWLIGDECGALDDAELIKALGSRLRAAGLPLDRLTLHLRTLHPEIIARTLAWAPGQAVEILDRKYGVEALAAFAKSPLRQAMERRQAMLVHLDPLNVDENLLDVFRGRRLGETPTWAGERRPRLGRPHPPRRLRNDRGGVDVLRPA
jgi:adenylate cyclase